MKRWTVWDLRKAIFWNRRWVSATSSVCCRIPCWEADCMVWNWIPSQGVLRRSCIRRQKSRWQVLKPPTAAISMIWPWAMCHLATTVSAISHMINSDFLSTTISLPRHWIRFVPVASWPLLPAAIRWIPKIRTHESIWRSGQNCWELSDFPTTHSVPMPVRMWCRISFSCKRETIPLISNRIGCIWG